jgi:hypothetical protein
MIVGDTLVGYVALARMPQGSPNDRWHKRMRASVRTA